ncbi:hypothetical protein [Henriciella litoralis]|uniref:hypothetical protein n=1 Tax=Henriciella litoralis TaxID=568102 RepID=UPI000A06DF92|nr:hypothetical protein [Henriciella litoralis]
MTFTVIPDAFPLSGVMAKLEEADRYIEPPIVCDTPTGQVSRRLLWPYTPGENAFVDSVVARQVWEYRHVEMIRDGLLQSNGHLILSSDQLPQREVAPRILDYIASSRLRYGIFDALDYRLAALKDYDGGQIFIPHAFAKKIIERITPKAKGGRPEHPAKVWYQERGCDRGGMTMKELQRQMNAAVGSAPSESIIRTWEREAKNRQ